MRASFHRPVLFALGWFSLGLGLVGIFVPLLPTTPFLLLAAYCFSRSSPRLHRWLLEHPRLGVPLKDWETHRVIRPRAKILAVGLMALSLSYPVGFMAIPAPAKVAAALVWAFLAIFILTRKSRP